MTQSTQTLDLAAVDTYLAQHLPGYRGPLEARKFETGQSNPTFLLVTPDRRYVLRRKPPGILLKSAHAVDTKMRTLSEAMKGADVVFGLSVKGALTADMIASRR